MDLSKKIRNGGVQGFNAKMLGKNTQGKGDFYRIGIEDEQYKKNYGKNDNPFNVLKDINFK